MGVFNCPVQISSLDCGNPRDMQVTVDTGATYTMLPAGLLRELGVSAQDTARFGMADGRIIEMDLGQAWVTIDGKSVVTLVVFGEDDIPALLGAYTLEGLRLAVDPVNRRLIPATAVMYSTRSKNP